MGKFWGYMENGLLGVFLGTLGWYFCILFRFIGVFEFSYLFVLGVFVFLIIPFCLVCLFFLNVVLFLFLLGEGGLFHKGIV